MPKVGCAQATFSLKFTLQSKREHGVDTHAVFIDLIKAHDSIKHEVILSAPRKIGALERCTRWVENLCGDFEVILKIGKEEIAIPCSCGVRKGDNFVPTIFIIVMCLVAEDTIDNLKRANMSLPTMMYNPAGQGILRLH